MNKSKTSKLERVIVTSIDQIPTSFTNEDEEREWWDTHDFSREVEEDLAPRYESLRSLMITGLRATEAPQVEFPLTLAKRSLRAMRRPARRRGYLYDRKIQDAASAITFAAAALEAGLNLYLTTGEDKEKAPSPQLAGTNPRKMLDAVLSGEKEQPPRTLTDRLRLLLERRNVIVQGLTSTDKSVPGTPGDWDVDNAPSLVDAAENFLDQFWLSPRGKVTRGFHYDESSET